MELQDDPELIEQYCEAHRHVWPEIIEGQRKVGIIGMDIYIYGRHLFMIMDTVDEFDFDRDMARLAEMPGQAEWEAFVSRFQGVDPQASATEKWHLMTKIFDQGI